MATWQPDENTLFSNHPEEDGGLSNLPAGSVLALILLHGFLPTEKVAVVIKIDFKPEVC